MDISRKKRPGLKIRVLPLEVSFLKNNFSLTLLYGFCCSPLVAFLSHLLLFTSRSTSSFSGHVCCSGRCPPPRTLWQCTDSAVSGCDANARNHGRHNSSNSSSCLTRALEPALQSFTVCLIELTCQGSSIEGRAGFS